MDNIKESFQRVKQDIFYLKQELKNLGFSFLEIKKQLSEMCEIVRKLNEKMNENLKLNQQTEEAYETVDNSFSPTASVVKTTQDMKSSADKLLVKPQKGKNMDISTRNDGVPADRQTGRQADRQTEGGTKNKEKQIENVEEIFNSLDNLKKEIRLKFKRLTDQEFVVFSTLYQLDDGGIKVDYKFLSEKLNLTESSIRDYIVKLLKKDAPIEKKKINNKQIHLKIQDNFKKIASLSTILQLRSV